MSEDDSLPARRSSPTAAVRSVARLTRERRISYVMLFRLGLLLLSTIIAGLSVSGVEERDPFYAGLTWTTLGLGFVLTILFARMLPRVERLDSFAFLQSAIDIVLSATLVQLTGGIDSGFVFLYLVAVVGAALMGNRAQCLAATGAAALIYGVLASLQISGLVEPMYPPGLEPSQDNIELLSSLLRTAGGIGAIGVLAAQLSAQLSRSGEEVLNLRALNEHIVQSLASGLATLDGERRVVLVNPQALRLLDCEQQQVLGQSATELFPGLVDQFAKASEDEHRFELTRTVAGQERQLGCSLGPLRDGQGESLGWVLHFQDITDLRKLELDARRSDRLAAIGRLAASVAHEVRNPLAAMSGSAELIDLDQLSEDDQRLLRIIRRETVRLDRLVGDLLTFTTPRVLQLIELNVVKLVADCVESFKADPSSAALVVRVHAPTEVTMWIDSGAMTQVMWNLLRNASTATNHSGEIEVRVFEEASARVIEVEDNGPGVPLEKRASVFDAFESSGQGGFGFGLALVRRLVREHGGEVTIHDRLDGQAGARVRLALPHRRPPPASGTFML